MEFGAKEIIIALGILVFIAIILDVLKRMRSSRYGNIRMPRRKQQPTFSGEDSDDFGSELPRGGARVVGYRNIDELESTLTDESELDQTKVNMAPEPATSTTPEVKPVKASKSQLATPQVSLDLGEQPAGDPFVIVIHMMAPQGEEIEGEALSNALLENGLRYGAMKIFHRHANQNGSGRAIFSVANSVNPGTFDLNAMHEFTTPGVTFLYSVEEADQPLESFDLLIATAQKLASTLGGELKDETRSALTRQTIEHCRQKITDHLRIRR